MEQKIIAGMLAAVMLSVALTSCARPNALGSQDTVTVRPNVPVIVEPDRPVLEKLTPEDLVEYTKLPAPVRAKLEGNNTKLQTWAEQLHVAIVEFNGFAKYNNSLSQQSVGVKEVK